MATGTPGNRRALPRRATGARTRPTGHQRRSDPARTGRSGTDRRRLGTRAAIIAAAKADDGATAPRPSPGTQWHPLGRAFGLLLARDAEGVWEMGGRLQTVSALVRSGSVATDRGGVGKQRGGSVAVGLLSEPYLERPSWLGQSRCCGCPVPWIRVSCRLRGIGELVLAPLAESVLCFSHSLPKHLLHRHPDGA